MPTLRLKDARILIVDDQEANVAVLKSLLLREGYTQIEAITDSRQVLRLYSEFSPDLILLDLVMPHLDGFGVLELLKAVILPDTYLPIIVLTADISSEARQRALSNGAKDFITKPIDLTEVAIRIRNLLETRFLHLQLQNRSQLLNEIVLERTSELTQTNEELRHINAQMRIEISERKQAQEALSESERQMKALVASLDDIIFELDEQGTYLNIWAADESLLVQPKEKLLEQKLSETMSTENAQLFLDIIQRVLRNTHPEEIEYPSKVRGKDRWFLARISPIYAEGRISSTVCMVVRDITDRKSVEARVNHEAARAEALLGIASQLNARLNLDAVLSTVCEAAAQALKTPVATVYFYEPSQDVFKYTAGFGLPTNYNTQVLPVPREIYERVILGAKGAGAAIENVQFYPELYDFAPIVKLDIRSIAVVNLMRGGQVIGSLAVYTTGEERTFTADDITLLQGLADQAALAIANARLYQEAQQRLLNMQAIHRIDTTINNTLDLHLVLRTILEQLTSHLHVDAANILLTNYQMNYLEFAVGHGFRTSQIQKTRVRFGFDLPGYVALEQRPVYIQRELEKQLEVQRFNLLAPEGFQGYYGIPLIARGKVQGVIEIFHRSPLDVTEEWLDFVATLAGQAALAIDNTNLFTSVQRSNMELSLAYDVTLEGWSRAMDLRDRETEGHTQRVAEMTVQMALALGLSDIEITNARRGALLHDMGKLGIPDEILHKPGKLTDEEWEIMKKHPTYAYEMLAPITFLRPSLEIPYCHHEKWDGTGYPRGLKGLDIPISARIFSVADVWDALRSDRPYRKAWNEDKVLSYIREHSGDYFDPQVVEVFLSLVEKTHETEGEET